MVGLIALVCAAANRAGAAEDPVWVPVPIPGGVAGLARAAQLGYGVEPWRVLYETSQRLHPTYGDPSEAAHLRKLVRAELQAAAPRVALAHEPTADTELDTLANRPADAARATVSLPLAPRLWRTAILDEHASDDGLVEAILARRDASLVYRGLFQMDDESLRFLGRHPDLLRWTREKRADVFSIFARSLRVQGGRVIVPGGVEAERPWADLLDESPANAESFLRKLLTGDEGRTMFLWDTLGRLEPAARRFALGEPDGDPRTASETLRGLASSFARGPAWWRPEGGAFVRPPVDPATVLGEVELGADGRPAPPASRAFWEAAFAGEVPGKAESLLSGPAIDAAWLVENVGLAPTPEKRRERLTTIAFAQRVFGAVTTATATDVLLTLRGLARRPALVLVLDRMDLETPATYARAVRRADEIAALGAGPRGARALAQFQGALALLDRARFARTLDVAQTEALVLSLAAVPVRSGGYEGGIARWAEERLLPALVPLVDPDPASASAEGTLLAALAGDRLTSPPVTPFEWEGLWYRALPGVGERRRLAAIRERQGGNRVDAVLAFARAVRLFQDHPGPEGLARLQESAQSLDASALSPDEQRDLRTLASGAPHRTDGLVLVADGLLSEALTALAYAPHLGSAQGPAVAGASVAARHEFGNQAWDLPEEVLGTGTPWHVRGSLLGLDLALARLSLRRWSAEMPSHPPGLDPGGALSFARTVVRSPFALHDEEAKAIAETIARGREQAATVAGPSAALALARDAGLDAWRAQGLRATLRDEPGAVGRFFTLGELLRLGQPPGPPSDAWGTPDLARGGSLHFLWPLRIGYDDLAGQRLDELQASRLPDLVLRVAIELDARGLPARLVPGVMSLFVQDFVQDATPIAHDDGLALARYAHDVPSERFDEYVSALAGDGPLVPAPDPGEAEP
jgi:hypothetical protein